LDVLNSGRYIKGPHAKAFEKEFSDYIGMMEGISVNSGTSALYIAFQALDLKRKDEIIVPSHTFFSSASQAMIFGAKPVFVDVDPDNFTMNVEQVKEKVTENTKAIVAVHIYGHPVDMDPLIELSSQTGIPIIEDCAQSHGSKYKGKLTGTFGDVSCFSFFPSKIMTVAGDGGMILTNNEVLAQTMNMLKDHGRKEKYKHELLGTNMRMAEIPAAIGRVQLKRLEGFIERRKEIGNKYASAFSEIPQVEPQKVESWADPVYYIYVIRIKNREKLAHYLKKKGIQTGVHYPIPLHQQPIILDRYESVNLPNTEELCKEILTIPLSAAMTDEEVDYVIRTIKEFY